MIDFFEQCEHCPWGKKNPVNFGGGIRCTHPLIFTDGYPLDDRFGRPEDTVCPYIESDLQDGLFF